MKFVVTGALGNIGSRLIREIPSCFPGSKILLLDNLSTQRYFSLFGLPSAGQYEFIEADIRDYDFSSVLSPGDVVVHLAAQSNPEESLKDEKEVEAINVLGTKRIAEACLQRGCSLIFPSTTSVTTAKNPYSASKLKAEKLLNAMSGSGLQFVILRLGTIFGYSPGMRFHPAVNRFCWQAVTKQPLSVWRHALDQSRPYLALSDAIQAVHFFIEKKHFDQKTYHLATTQATVRQVLEVISQHVPDLSWQAVDAPIQDPESYLISTEDVTQLGFRFQSSLPEGIEEILGQFKSLIKDRRF
jgi:nucleoside-diphosphate-sugar epimerase